MLFIYCRKHCTSCFFVFFKAYVVRDPLKYMSGPTPEMLDVNLSFSDENYHRTE